MLVIFIIFLNLLLLVAWFGRGLYKGAKAKRLLKHGVSAHAVLLNIQPTGVYINTFPQMQLQMQVFSKTGRNFVAEVCEIINPSDLDHLQVGRFMEIKYNPSNTREVLLVKLDRNFCSNRVSSFKYFL